MKTEKLKFKVVKAGDVRPEQLVIARMDGMDMKDNFHLVINLAKPYGQEVYDVLKKYGYEIPKVEAYLRSLNANT